MIKVTCYKTKAPGGTHTPTEPYNETKMVDTWDEAFKSIRGHLCAHEIKLAKHVP